MSKPLRRRKAFILIEVLVATSLFVLMLTAIFGIFWRTAKTNHELNKLRIANEHLLITQARLQEVFSGITNKKSPKPYFYVEPNNLKNGISLVFTTERLQEHEDVFSVDVIIKLYVEDGQLILATFPYFEEEEGIPNIMQKEALLSNVTDLKAEFFLGQESEQESQKKEEKEEDTSKKPPRGRWTDMWLQEYDRTPNLVKLHIKREKSSSCTLWIFLPTTLNTIVYDKE